MRPKAHPSRRVGSLTRHPPFSTSPRVLRYNGEAPHTPGHAMPRRLLAVLLVALPSAVRAAPPDFDREVAPLLAAKCLDCHRGAKPKGDLDLSRKASVVGDAKGSA